MVSRVPSVVFSLSLHALLFGGLLLLERDVPPNAETVYRVSLAELAQPAAPPAPEPPAHEPPAPEPPAPVPEPDLVPEPEPAPESDVLPEPPKPEPVVRKISPKKLDKPAAKPKPKPAPRTPVPAVASPAPAGPVARNVGGYSVYEDKTLDQRPSVTRRATPEYPARARRMNVQGVVTVQMVVDTSGKPQHCVVVTAQPDGWFEEAALNAAKRMRFMPGRLHGQPVNTLVMLPFAFRLR